MRFVARATLALGCALGVPFAAGCEARTQLVVVVDSDLQVGAELGAVVVEVAEVHHRFEMGEQPLPLSLGVAPRGGGEEVTITARALGPDDAELMRIRANTRFVEGRVIRVDLPLARACTTIECEDACHHGACVSSFRDPADLPDDEGGEPPSLFDDAPPPPDAGAPPDGCAVEGDPCGEPCHPGAMVCDPDPRCALGDPIPAGGSCGDGRACDAEGRCGG